ncbi:MAG TPA: T9SS type A sorting domain-containing protein, partial [Candidatus Cloacimonadota bacterium]|nr:T9SS type A sorting domain-containing protein [Candidatus Cloacimonadota bacterium]
RLSLIAAADDLYGVSSTESQTVALAFDQVGILDTTPPAILPSEELPPVKGEEWIAFVAADSTVAFIKEDLSDGFNIPNHKVRIGAGGIASLISLTRDGRRLCFINDKGNPVLCYTGDISRGEYRIDEPDFGLPEYVKMTNASLCPDGRTIAFVTNGGPYDPYIHFLIPDAPLIHYPINLQNTSIALTGAPSYTIDVLDWAPDGKVLTYDAAFLNITPDDTSLIWDISQLIVETGKAYRTIAPVGYGRALGNPEFGSNSPFLTAYNLISADFDTVDIYLQDIQQGINRRIIRNGFRPSFSRLDNKLVFQSFNNVLWTYSLDVFNPGFNNLGISGQNPEYFTILHEAPIAIADTVQEVTAASANLYAILAPNGAPTTVTFEYGDTPMLGMSIQAAQNPVLGTSPFQVSAPLSGLEAGQEYFYRVKATNSEGESMGDIRSFVTLASTSHFTAIRATSDSMMVYFLPGVVPYIALENMQNGDEIAVISPEGICVGNLVWESDSQSPRVIKVWHDDPGTTEKDGMLDGEIMNYRIWDHLTSTEYLAVANYSLGSNIYKKNDVAIVESMYTTEVIPVEFCAFEAVIAKLKIILKWMTATETNNLGFSVEKKSSLHVWEEIGFVPGCGTTLTPQVYSFVDPKPQIGTNEYRLKQIDTDGSYSYTASVVASFSVPISFQLEQNYPNPFNARTKINFALPEDSDVKLSLYDMKGNLVKAIAEQPYSAGFHCVECNLSNLASGVYVYKLESLQYIAAKKLLLVK